MLLYSVFAGVSNTVGRAAGGVLASLPRVDYVHVNNVTVLLAGVATLLVGPLCRSFAALVVYGVVLGFCVGECDACVAPFIVPGPDSLWMRLTLRARPSRMLPGSHWMRCAPVFVTAACVDFCRDSAGDASFPV